MTYNPYNIVVTHGFEFDQPGIDSLDSVLLDYRTQIEVMVDQPVFMHSWYSAPFGMNFPREVSYSIYNTAKVWIKSWFAGHFDPYSWAYHQLAQAGIDSFIQMIKTNYAKYNQKVVVVGHSLGSKIAISACAQVPEMVDKLVLLNGAFLVSEALPMIKTFTFPVLNIAVQNDEILGFLGAKFSGDGDGTCIGHQGLGALAGTNWVDVILDDQRYIDVAKKRGWTICGDTDGDLGEFLENHWFSYRNPGNAPLVRSFLSGDPLADFKAI